MKKTRVTSQKLWFDLLDTYTKWSPQMYTYQLSKEGRRVELKDALIVARQKFIPGCTHENEMYPTFTDRVEDLKARHLLY